MKFAYLDYVASKEEIPVKYGILRKAPEKFFSWYVKRYNPFIAEDYALLSETGYQVKIPIEKSKAGTHIAEIVHITELTMEDLKQMDVGIVSMPKNLKAMPPQGIALSDKKRAMPFFSMEIIKKALKLTAVDLKAAEIAVIAEDLKLSELVVSMVYPHVNFLTVICLNQRLYQYFCEKAHEIFEDTGLNLQVYFDDSDAIENADIVLNTSMEFLSETYFMKSGSAYIDFTENPVVMEGLQIKREDLHIIDQIMLDIGKNEIDLEFFDMFLYMNLRDYQNYILKPFRPASMKSVRAYIDTMPIKVKDLYCFDQALKRGRNIG